MLANLPYTQKLPTESFPSMAMVNSKLGSVPTKITDIFSTKLKKG